MNIDYYRNQVVLIPNENFYMLTDVGIIEVSFETAENAGLERQYLPSCGLYAGGKNDVLSELDVMIASFREMIE